MAGTDYFICEKRIARIPVSTCIARQKRNKGRRGRPKGDYTIAQVPFAECVDCDTGSRIMAGDGPPMMIDQPSIMERPWREVAEKLAELPAKAEVIPIESVPRRAKENTDDDDLDKEFAAAIERTVRRMLWG